MKLLRNITYEQFVDNVIIRRKLYATGRVEYKGEFEMNGSLYSENLNYKMNEPEDLSYYDTFAREQLIRKLLKQVNNGV